MGGLALGILAALGWGIGDFYGGIASRRFPPLLVALGSMCCATPILLAALLLRGSALTLSQDLLWALVTGSLGACGLIGFYHLLARGNMAVNAPLTALTATSIPVVFGIANDGLPGPLRVVGIALALCAILLISQSPGVTDSGDGRPRLSGRLLLEPMVVGGIFGVCLVCLDQVNTRDVFAPLLVLRIAGISTLLLVLLLRPATRRPIIALWRQKEAARNTFAPGLRLMALIGTSDLGATGAFMLAAQLGNLTIIAVLGSLYPAVTVLLARLLDKERLSYQQLLGLAFCFGAITLISLP